ncbi:MAG: long-chain fatty acid--CoA ligase [candidate division KSB1 bacterium]|nr:long-chain fatty acid--CoA ligase [candidate division KSB1 bacterium]
MERPWLKYYEEQVPPTIDIPEIPMTQLFDKAVKEYPNHTAVIFFGNKISYQQLDQLVNQFASALNYLGVKKGDRVALILPNIPQYPICHWAAMKLGAILVPTNPLYVERELEYQLNNSGAETAVVLDLLARRVNAVKDKTKLKQIIFTRVKEYLPPLLKMLYPIKELKEGTRIKIETGDGVYLFADLMNGKYPAPPEVKLSPDDIALLLYTGGTTGISKGAILTHRNIVANVLQVKHWLWDIQDGKEVILSVLPFFHSYGMTTCQHLAIASGSAMVLVPRFEIKQILKFINQYHPTLFPGVPTMYVAINNYPEVSKYRLSSIRVCVSGGAALPVEVQKTFEKITGGRLVEGYGLSETSPVTHVNPIFGHRKEGSIGIPISNTDSQVVDPESKKVLSVGEIGELAIKGPQVMKGYWQMEEETKNALVDGWFFTGDMAKMDEEGYFYIVDRKKDMILSGGFNIYPREIEEVLFEHPKIMEAAAIGVPDAYKGEVVKVFVVLKEGETATEQEIIDFCQGKLAKFKLPRYVEFRKELPKSLIGKVLRRVLQEEEKAKHKPIN